MQSIQLTPEQQVFADQLFNAWQITYNDLAPYVCSIQNYKKSDKTIRNELRKNHRQILEDTTRHIAKVVDIKFEENQIPPSWLWSMVVFSIVANRKTMDKQIFDQVKQELYQNFETTTEEVSIVMYLASLPKLFIEAVSKRLFDLPKKLSNKDVQKLYKNADQKRIRKLFTYAARRYRQLFHSVHTYKNTWMKWDYHGYGIKHYIDKKGKACTKINLHDLQGSGKKHWLELRGRFYTAKKGKKNCNLTVVYDRDKNQLVFQRLVHVKRKRKMPGENVGMDAGMTSLISTSHNKTSVQLKADHIAKKEAELEKTNNKAKGTIDTRTFKECSAKNSKFYNDRGKQRNRMRSRLNNYKNKLSQIQYDLDHKELTEEQRLSKTNQKYGLMRKIERIETNNMGSKTYHKESEKRHVHMENMINREIALVLEDDNQIDTIIMEDLDIRGAAGPFAGLNRKLSYWMYGILQTRIEYKASLKSIPVKYVNQAYSSQYCHLCGSKIKRDKDHYENASCPIHGNINADTNAAHNLVWMYESYPKVTKYTPRDKIKRLYEMRHKETLNAIRSLTSVLKEVSSTKM